MIDEAGARQRLLEPDGRVDTIGTHEIEDVVARMARIPPRQVSRSDRDALRTLERDLKLTVFGQDPAIETLSSAIKMARSGLVDTTVRSARTCLPARPGWARPRSRASSR